jgi:septal ring factor EnvC (AmiA/AmiB activator)
VSVEKNVRAGRIPQKHLDLWKESYRLWQDGQEPPVDGTPIKDWSSISPAQCKNLLNAGCRSVEDLAQANDEAMRRLGMGANDLKNKARAWLQAAKDHGPLTMQIASLEKENDQLKGTIQSLQDQIKRFEIRMDAQDNETNQKASWEVTDIPAPESGVLKETTIPNPEARYDTESLADRYFQKFGKKPHHLMKQETILKKLQE